MSAAALAGLIGAVGALDMAAMEAARSRQEQLTKPGGSLGRLEALSITLAGITAQPRPRFRQMAIVVGAGDHGVAEQGVSAFPQAVTRQMVANFVAGGAAINVLARRAGARVVVADFGVAGPEMRMEGLVSCRVGSGTRDFTTGGAMTREQATEAIVAGAGVFAAQHAQGLDAVAIGEMGIANSTAAAALAAVFLGLPPAEVTGRGTGVDDAGLLRKIDAIERGIAINTPDTRDPLGVLAALGGFEIAGLAGVVLAAAGARVPVVVDGFISTAAALAAVRLCPAVGAFLVASHRSPEPGHALILRALGLDPLLDLGMRLGEGSGAALGLQLLESAAAILDEMATFGEAGVSEREDS